MLTIDQAVQFGHVWTINDDCLPVFMRVVGVSTNGKELAVMHCGKVSTRSAMMLCASKSEAISLARSELATTREYCERKLKSVADATDKLNAMSPDEDEVPLGRLPTQDETPTCEICKHELGGEG